MTRRTFFRQLTKNMTLALGGLTTVKIAAGATGNNTRSSISAAYNSPHFRAVRTNGQGAGDRLYIYKQGTTELVVIYSDIAKIRPRVNPLTLDKNGEAIFFLDPHQAYSFALRDKNDITIWSQDHVAIVTSAIDFSAFRGDLAGISGAQMVGFSQPGSGAVLLPSLTKLRERVSVRDFGAIGDGIADDTAALQKAIDYLAENRILGTLGIGRIHLTKGRFLCNGTITISKAIGLEFVGDSQQSSLIMRSNDSGELFVARSYSSLIFSNLSMLHTSAKSTSSNWTNTCLALNGTGAGQGLRLNNVRTAGFNRVIDFRAQNANEDTTYATDCRFSDFNTFLYSRSSQAVINKFTQCTWVGTVDDIFNIGGYGHTHLDTCNVVTSGVLFALAGGVQGPQSQYICTNVKMEYWPQRGAGGTSQIIKMADAAYAQFKFVGGGLAGGSPHASIYQIDLKPLFTKIIFEGGSWDDRIKIRSTNAANTTSYPQTNSLLKFEGCTTSPLPSNVAFQGGGASASWCPVVWRDCVNRVNLCLTGSGISTSTNSAVSGNYLRNRNTATGSRTAGAILSGTSTTHAFPHYGQPAFVRAINVAIIDQGAIHNGKIRAYGDNAKTKLIGEMAIIADAQVLPKLYAVPFPDSTLITEGIYVELSNASPVTVLGRVYIETDSV